MSEAGSLRDAVAVLYSSDPGEFTEQRKALVARAREGGDKSLAKTIGALRKPTRAAWVVNMLVRADRFAVPRMTALGDDLREAERAVDGARIRELSKRRRELMAGLLQQAFSAAGQESPPAALRDEVTSTLTAALADPQVAEQLRAGTLVRAVYRDGFAILEAEDPAAWADASAGRAATAAKSPRPKDGEVKGAAKGGATKATAPVTTRPARKATGPEPSRPGRPGRPGRVRLAPAPEAGAEPEHDGEPGAGGGRVAGGEPGAGGSRVAGGRAGRGAAPGKAAPGKAAPGRAAPGETAPGKAKPGQATRDETAPGETAPGETAPGETAPGETAPGRATRKEPQSDQAGRARAARERAAQERAAKDRAEQERRARERAKEEQANRARAEREARQAALAEARQTAASADRAATAAAREEEDAARSVRALTEELAKARQRHAEARVNARQAQAAQRRAQERLTRLRD